MLRVLAVEGYRSLRRAILPMAPLTVVTGPNGSGKSSLYRSMRLLAETAQGGAIGALAREGGLQSTLWAGPEVISRSVREGTHPVQGTRRIKPVSLKLGFAGDEFSYAIDFGLPPQGAMFPLDPQIKEEAIWVGPVLRPAAVLAKRSNAVVMVRDADGQWADSGRRLSTVDSMLSHLSDPVGAPEVFVLREQIRSWRFYDGFRTDAAAPARTSRVGTYTPVLADDGGDVAAALATLYGQEAGEALDAAVENAFPGSTVQIGGVGGQFTLELRQHGLLRPLGAAELSDGTLRYLLWVAALLSQRPPALFVLNEPETSLHPELLPPLAQLIADTAAQTQVVTVTHSRPLLAELRKASPRLQHLELEKTFGETHLVGQRSLDEPSWHWPSR